MAAIGFLGSLTGTIFASVPFGFGVLLGTTLALINYFWLRRSLERMFADFGATPFGKTVPVIDGCIEVPQGPGLGADPEDDLIAQFSV